CKSSPFYSYEFEMRFFTYVVVLSMAVASSAAAQPLKPGEWRTYTSMRSIRDVAITSDSTHAWAVTEGGAFRLDLRDSSQPLSALRTTDGISENDLTAVASDAEGTIYFGGRDGGFDVLHSSGTI